LVTTLQWKQKGAAHVKKKNKYLEDFSPF